MEEKDEQKLLPRSDYNPVEAKFCACLFWLVFHATEDGDFENIPPEITCPTERGIEGKFQVRPLVAEFLCNCFVYKKVCSQFFGEERRLDSFWDIIQELSNDGYYVIDSSDEAVTEKRLSELTVFDVDAHLALVDAIMSAHTNNSVSIQQIVTAVSAFASYSATKELPFDLEDALLLWLNKINATNSSRMQKGKSVETNASLSPRRFRFKKDQVSEKQTNLFPKLDDISNDVADGKALLSLVHFYCPHILALESIKLSDPTKQGDAVYNIELFRELCAQHICTSVFALRTEDFIYKAPELKNNVIALLSEMFIKLELEKESDINVNILENGDLKSMQEEVDTFGSQSKDAVVGVGGAPERKTGTTQSFVPTIERTSANIERIGYVSSEREISNRPSSNRGDLTDTYPRDKVDMSIEDQLAKLKSFGSAGRDELRRDAEQAVAGQSSAAKPQKSRQPLLSKRSKKQLAALGDDDRCLSAEDLSARSPSAVAIASKAALDMLLCLEFYLEEDDFYKNKDLQDTVLELFKTVKWFRMVRADQVVNGMQLVDFDLKRSHSLTSVVGKANFSVDPGKSVRAWEGGKKVDDSSKLKSQKISLEFKPEPTPYRRQHLSGSVQGSAKHDVSDDVIRPSSQRSAAGLNATKHNSVLVDKTPMDDTVGKASDFVSSLNGSFSDPEEVGDLSDRLLGRTTEIADAGLQGDFVEPQLEEDDYLLGTKFGQPVVNQAELAIKHASPRPNKLIGICHNDVITHNDILGDTRQEDHDDDLSTIAETSEPSTPTVYSFDTRRSFGDSSDSRTVESDSPRMSLSDSQFSPTIPSGDITPLNSVTDMELSLGVSHEVLGNGEGQSSVDMHRSADSARQANQRQVFVHSERQHPNHHGDQHLLEASDLVPAASYTIMSSDMSLETAKAAGLPIISDEDNLVANSIRSSLSNRDEEELYKNLNGEIQDIDYSVDTVRPSRDYSKSSCEHTKTFLIQGKDEVKVKEKHAHPVIERGDNNNARKLVKEVTKDSVTNEESNTDGITIPGFKDRSYPRVENEALGSTSNLSHNGRDVDLSEESIGNESDLITDKLSDFTSEVVSKSATMQKTESFSQDPLCDISEDHAEDSTSSVTEHASVSSSDAKEVLYETLVEGTDFNVTTTWSDVKHEQKVLRDPPTSPGNGKRHCISTIANGPVTNWAQFAQDRGTEAVSLSEIEGNHSKLIPLQRPISVLEKQVPLPCIRGWAH